MKELKTRMFKTGTWTYRLLSYVLVLAMVIGSIVIPTPMEVKAAADDMTIVNSVTYSTTGASYKLTNVTVKPTVSATNVMIDVDKGWIDLPDEIDDKTKYPSYSVIRDKENSTFIISFATPVSGDKIQDLILGIRFFPESSNQTVTIVLNNDATQVPSSNASLNLEKDVKLTAYHNSSTMHYYMFVPKADTSWVEAYNEAKQWSLMGMKGYLATITSAEENSFLSKINEQPGWAGGIRKRALCKDADAITVADLQNASPEITISKLDDRFYFDGDRDGNIDNWNNFREMYWAAGPEANQKVPDSFWAQSGHEEPNNDFSGQIATGAAGRGMNDIDTREGCLQLHYDAGTTSGWNDLPNKIPDETNSVAGYFVEFGGYASDNPNNVDQDTVVIGEGTIKKIPVSGAITGANAVNADTVIFTINTPTGAETIPVPVKDDNAGNYTYDTYLPAGDYTVTVEDGKGVNMPATGATSVTVPAGSAGLTGQDLDVGGGSGTSANKTAIGTITGTDKANAKAIVIRDTAGNELGRDISLGDAENGDKTFRVNNVTTGIPLVVEVYDSTDITTGNKLNVTNVTPTSLPTTGGGEYNGMVVTVDAGTTLVNASGKVIGSNAGNAKNVIVTMPDGTKKTCPVATDGTYTIPGVVAGQNYPVEVVDQNGKNLYANRKSVTVGTGTGNPVPNLTVNKADVSGTITGAKSGEADRVILTDPNTGRSYTGNVVPSTTGGDPTYKVEGVPSGTTYNVEVEDKGNPAQLMDVTDKNGNPNPKVNVPQATSGALTGQDLIADEKLVNATGKVVGNNKDKAANVIVTMPGGSTVTCKVTNGSYTIPNVVEGQTYSAKVVDNDGIDLCATPANVTVGTDDKVNDLTVNKTTVSGKVEGTDKDKATTIVFVDPETGKEIASKTLNPDKTYSVDLPDGKTANVQVLDQNSKDLSPKPGSITVPENAGATLPNKNFTVGDPTATVNGDITGNNAPAAKDVILTDTTDPNKKYPGTATTTGGKTTYEVPNVPAGTYDVTVKDKDGNDLNATPTQVILTDTNQNGVLDPEEARRNLKVNKTDLTGEVKGTNKGNAATVILSKVDPTGATGTTTKVAEVPVKVGEDGKVTYDIPNVVAGNTYKIEVVDKDGKDLYAEIDPAPTGTAPDTFTVGTTPAAKQTVDVKVDKTTSDLSGKITGSKADEADKVILTDENGKKTEVTPTPSTTTGEKDYQADDLPSGDYTVQVVDKDGKDLYPDPDHITIPNDKNTPKVTQDLKVADPVTITGKITGNAADDVAEVILKNTVTGKEFPGDVVKEKNTYYVNDIPAGTYDVTVKGYGGKTLNASCDPTQLVVTTTKTSGYDLKVDYITVTGKITGDGAEDAVKVILTPVDKDGKPNGTPIEGTASNGSYEVKDVPAGDYAVTVVEKDGLEVTPTPAKITVTPTDTKKDLTIDALDARKDKAKEEIDNLKNLTDDEKKKDKDEVDKAKDKDGVDKALTDAVKDDAKKEIDKKAEAAKKAIDGEDAIPDDIKKELKDKVDEEAKKAKDAIDKADTVPKVKDEVTKGKKAIDDVLDVTLISYKKLTITELEIIKTKKTIEETEKTITNINSDKGDPAGSGFQNLRLLGIGKTKKIDLRWRVQSNADGYFLYGQACGKKYVKLATIKNNKLKTYKSKDKEEGTIAKYTVKKIKGKKLKKGTYYKFIVVAYKEIGGKKYVLETSNSAHAVTNGGKRGNTTAVVTNLDKKGTVTVKKGKTFKINATYKSKKKVTEHIRTIRFESSNKKVAKVVKKTKDIGKKKGSATIKGVKKGTCTIYVFTQNGYYKKIKVKVK